jgi:hypothetical protein
MKQQLEGASFLRLKTACGLLATTPWRTTKMTGRNLNRRKGFERFYVIKGFKNYGFQLKTRAVGEVIV